MLHRAISKRKPMEIQMTSQAESQIEYIAYGSIPAMVAEYAAHDMGADWFKANQYKYALLPIGPNQYTTEYFRTKADAKACAKEYAAYIGCKVVRI
jgi:hypothetical protein